MRRCLAFLALLAVLLVPVLLAPGASSARCRPSPGDQLVVITPRASHGVVLLQRRPAYSDAGVLTGDTPTTLTLRRTGCTRGCVSNVALRAIAPNLYALTVPGSSPAGTYEITTAAATGRFESGPSSSPASPIGAAPATTGIEGQMVGTGFFAPSIVLSAPAPADAVGVLARWQGSSLFMPAQGDRARFLLFAGRCRGPLPGFTPPHPGTDVELVFVDAEGRLSPSAHVTLRDVSLGAR